MDRHSLIHRFSRSQSFPNGVGGGDWLHASAPALLRHASRHVGVRRRQAGGTTVSRILAPAGTSCAFVYFSISFSACCRLSFVYSIKSFAYRLKREGPRLPASTPLPHASTPALLRHASRHVEVRKKMWGSEFRCNEATQLMTPRLCINH